jgi:hypothetical protein
MLLSRHRSTGQNRDIKIANTSFENVSHLKYLGIRVTNQKLIHEDIKRELILVMFATIWFRAFCLLVYCRET